MFPNVSLKKLYITYDATFAGSEGIYPGDGPADAESSTAAIAIFGDKTSPYNNSSVDNIIKQCTVENFGKVHETAYNYGTGIKLISKCERNHIYSNYVSGAGRSCILDILHGDYPNSLNTVSGNVFKSSTFGTKSSCRGQSFYHRYRKSGE